MYTPTPPDNLIEPTEVPPDERKRRARRVHFDASTPPIRSIVRVVVVTLLLLLVAGYLQSIITALSYLFFLIVLSVFFAYLIDPIVKLIRRPFKERSIERWMPRSLAIPLAYIIVFTVVGLVIANVAPRVVDQPKEFGNNLTANGQAIPELTN